MVAVGFMYAPLIVCGSFAYEAKRWVRMGCILVLSSAGMFSVIIRFFTGTDAAQGNAALGFWSALVLYFLLSPLPLLRFFKRVLVGDMTSNVPPDSRPEEETAS